MNIKNRSELEAEAMRLIAAVNDNIVLDAKEVLVRALDQMQVDGAKASADIIYALEKQWNDSRRIWGASGMRYAREAIHEALENREKL